MIEERLQDLSVFYYIKEQVDDTVKVVDGFPSADELKLENLPIVAVENREATFDFFELGSKDQLVTRKWVMYVYAKNKAQRDNLAYTIAKSLRNSIGVYNYDMGFPPTTVPKIGALVPKRISLVIAQIDPSVVKTLYYRAEVYYSANYLSKV